MIQQSHSWAYMQRKTWPKGCMHPNICDSAVRHSKMTWEQARCPQTGVERDDTVQIQGGVPLGH